MVLVRCPTHQIPYNNENPRGCPACARERDAGGASAIQELARASRGVKAPPEQAGAPGRRSTAGFPAVTPPPRLPVPYDTALGKLLALAQKNRSMTAGSVAIVILLLLLLGGSGPTFVEAPDPAPFDGQPRPLAVEPNADIRSVFAALGTQAPQANPNAPRTARYTYGTGLIVDEVNGTVYAVTFTVPSRAWRGLQPGMPARGAEGSLALLGQPQEIDPPGNATPQQLGQYSVYRSLDQRPRRTLRAEVRPPNGCFDVLVTLQPQAIGTLVTNDRRYAVIGGAGATPQWVVTQVRVVSRSVRGPYADGLAC